MWNVFSCLYHRRKGLVLPRLHPQLQRTWSFRLYPEWLQGRLQGLCMDRTVSGIRRRGIPARFSWLVSCRRCQRHRFRNVRWCRCHRWNQWSTSQKAGLYRKLSLRYSLPWQPSCHPLPHMQYPVWSAWKMPGSTYCQGHLLYPVQIRRNGKRSFQDVRPLPIFQKQQRIWPYPILSQWCRRPQYRMYQGYPVLLPGLPPHL